MLIRALFPSSSPFYCVCAMAALRRRISPPYERAGTYHCSLSLYTASTWWDWSDWMTGITLVEFHTVSILISTAHLFLNHVPSVNSYWNTECIFKSGKTNEKIALGVIGRVKQRITHSSGRHLSSPSAIFKQLNAALLHRIWKSRWGEKSRSLQCWLRSPVVSRVC